MSRRLVESVGQQEARPHGYVYHKKRKHSDRRIPTERAYERYRVDVLGKQNAMSAARVLDAAKLRERISSTSTFAQQAQ